jgi:hypothetical protein
MLGRRYQSEAEDDEERQGDAGAPDAPGRASSP